MTSREEIQPYRLMFIALLLFGPSEELFAGPWPQWRGPRGNGVSEETNLPKTWSESEGIAWKTPLPEWGTSTPVIWEDAIFVTMQHDGELLLMRLSAVHGEPVWTQVVGQGEANRAEKGSGKRTAKFHDLHNLASPSPVTDGERVIVHFGNGDLASYKFDGTREWHRNLAEDFGRYTIWWGHANSPVLAGNVVISVCMQDSLAGTDQPLSPSYLVAHDKTTGNVVWDTRRMTGADAEQCDSYTTPILIQHGSHSELVVMGGNWLDGYDPATGERLWHLPGLVGGRTITGPTAANGLIFATAGMRGPLFAVKLGGRKELKSDDAVAWKETQSTPDSCCPVVWKDWLWMVTDNGVASCLETASGNVVWRERLGENDYKASPIVADGNVYFLSKSGVTTVLKAQRDYEVVSANKLEDEFLASPAVSNGRIYLRGRKALYAIGK
jgi:outer membrane protein assembly factor BamB